MSRRSRGDRLSRLKFARAMNKAEIVRRIVEPGIVAVIRADSSEHLGSITQALAAGGVTAIEITMTTPDALISIGELTARFGEACLIGVGTVLDCDTCRAAIDKGAQFVVTPVTRPDVIRLCNELEKPIASGAYSPTEALLGHECGADFIKIFPADQLGPTFIKSLLAPLPMLRVIPSGGVSTNTAADFIRAGCVALSAGSTLVSRDAVRNRDWEQLSATATEFVRAVRDARAGAA